MTSGLLVIPNPIIQLLAALGVSVSFMVVFREWKPFFEIETDVLSYICGRSRSTVLKRRHNLTLHITSKGWQIVLCVMSLAFMMIISCDDELSNEIQVIISIVMIIANVAIVGTVAKGIRNGDTRIMEGEAQTAGDECGGTDGSHNGGSARGVPKVTVTSSGSAQSGGSGNSKSGGSTGSRQVVNKGTSLRIKGPKKVAPYSEGAAPGNHTKVVASKSSACVNQVGPVGNDGHSVVEGRDDRAADAGDYPQQLAVLRAQLREQDVQLREQDVQLQEQEMELARLRAAAKEERVSTHEPRTAHALQTNHGNDGASEPTSGMRRAPQTHPLRTYHGDNAEAALASGRRGVVQWAASAQTLAD